MTTWTELNRHRAIFPLQEGTAETKHGVSNVLCVLARPDIRTLFGLASVSVCLAGLCQIKMKSGRVGDKCLENGTGTRINMPPASFCSLRTIYYTKSPFGTPHRKLLFAETSASWLDWSAILASVDWYASARPACKKSICCQLALKNAFTQTDVAFCNETDLLQSVRWALRKTVSGCLKLAKAPASWHWSNLESNLECPQDGCQTNLDQ